MKKQKFAKRLAPNKQNYKAVMKKRVEEDQIRRGLTDASFYIKHFFEATDEEISEKLEKETDTAYMGAFPHFVQHYQKYINVRLLRRMAIAYLAKENKDVICNKTEILNEFKTVNPSLTDSQISEHLYCVLRALYYWKNFKSYEDLAQFQESDDVRVTEEMKPMTDKFFTFTDRPKPIEETVAEHPQDANPVTAQSIEQAKEVAG
jgi:hypothetical protein